MKRLHLSLAFAVATVGLAGAANAQTVTVSTNQSFVNEVLTNAGGTVGSLNMVITSTGTATFTGALTGAQVQNSIGPNIDNQGGNLVFSSAGKFADSDGYNILNESGGTTTINSGVFAGSLAQNVEDTGGQLNVNGGTFQSSKKADGASDILANGSTANVKITNLGGTGTPTFTTAGSGVDFMAENDGTILITGSTGYTFSLTGTPGTFDFTGDLAAGSGSFFISNGGADKAYTYDIASGGTIALGALSATPEPLSSTTLALGALGIALLVFRSRRKMKAAL